MRLIPLILRMTRVFTAATLLIGPAAPAFAKPALPSSAASKEGAAVRPGGAKKTARSARALPAGPLKLPMYFEANNGQIDPSVRFFTRAGGYNLYLTASEAVMVLSRSSSAKSRKPEIVRMKLKGANAAPLIKGLGVLPGRTSYFFGSDPSKWQTGVKQYDRVKFAQVYPGIDMVYRFDKGNVEYDFVVAPGANTGRILMGFEGAKSLKLDPRGNLVLRLADGELTYKAPKLYQMVGTRKLSVKGRFVLASNNNVRFEVGDYIKSRELVIDPAIMYGTYLGGTVADVITGIKVDGARQAYVTGYSASAPNGVSGFPDTTPSAHTYPFPIGPNKGGNDVFVAKLSEDGARLLWLAWLGGALNDRAKGIALDDSSVSSPNIFITGETTSAGAGTAFPIAGPAMQTCNTNTGSLAFVTQLTQSGNIPSLLYSTCWGGVEGIKTNTGNAIAVDSLGAAYVTGTTEVDDASFPIVGTAAGVYAAPGGAFSGFVFKVNPSGTGGVAYSMFLGNTSGTTYSNTIAVDALGQAWVAGKTASDTWPAAPRAGHFAQTRTAGGDDVFVAQVNSAGNGLNYMTYVNGDVNEEATAIALNNGGAVPYHVFVAGWSVSDTDFPSTAYLLLPVATRPVVYQKTLPGLSGDAAFVLRLNPAEPDTDANTATNNSLEMQYATYLGSTDGADRAYSLALDSRDDAYVAGWTEGNSGWPVATDPLTVGTAGLNMGGTATNTSAGRDAFVAAISTDGARRPFFTFLGATPTPQEATGIDIDNQHNIYVAGFTGSAIFPTTTGSLEDGTSGHEINRGAGAGAFDGFVVKVAPVESFGAPLAACTITGINPVSGLADGGTVVTITGTGFVADFGAGAVTFDAVNAASYSVNAASTVITAVSPRHPLTGALSAGTVPLTVSNTVGTCSMNYTYTLAGAGSCGDDYFFPSPATGATGTFAYCMSKAGTAKIRIYNAIGDLVAKIEDTQPAGAQRSVLNTGRLAPGVYLYRLEKDYGGGDVSTTKVRKFAVQH